MSMDIYPPQYYYRHKRESDLSWITAMLKIIPSDLREASCNEYSKIYGNGTGDKRKLANTYLKTEAAKHRSDK
ncbi:MAG: hypothetical protein ACJAV1_002731 [Paraglaciecola sp.]|jgi:hypothetical protein